MTSILDEIETALKNAPPENQINFPLVCLLEANVEALLRVCRTAEEVDMECESMSSNHCGACAACRLKKALSAVFSAPTAKTGGEA